MSDPPGLSRDSVLASFDRAYAADAAGDGPAPEYADAGSDEPADMSPERFDDAVAASRPGVLAPWTISGVAGSKPRAAHRYSAVVYPLGGGKIPVTAGSLTGLFLEVQRVTARQDRPAVGVAGAE